MDTLRELWGKALAEGLIPFMMMQTNGTKPRKNAIRLFELALVIIPLLLSITYYGGKMVHALETVTTTQEKLQTRIELMNRDGIETKIGVAIIKSQLTNHIKYEAHGEYNAEAERFYEEKDSD